MSWLGIRDRMKIFRQKKSRSVFVHAVFAWLASNYIRFVFFTARRQLVLPEGVQDYISGEKNCIFAFWHGRLMMVPPYKPPLSPMAVLISQHNDGQLVAMAMKRFSIDTVRGSSSRGGSRAGREVVQRLKEGSNISITPDGPRGPNRQAQAGIIHLARMCGKPILPLGISCSRHKALKSWDRMQIALPFGKIAACIAEPVFVPEDADDETTERARLLLEERLNAATRQADELVGLSAARSEKSATQRGED